MLSPSPLALNLSQHQGLFQWVSSLSSGQSNRTSTSVLPIKTQDWFPFSSVQFSCSVVFGFLGPHGLKHTCLSGCQASLTPRLPCLSPTPRSCSNSCPSSQWCIQPSHPLSSPFPPAFSHSQHQGLLQWVSSSHQMAKVLGVSASAPVLPMNI